MFCEHLCYTVIAIFTTLAYCKPVVNETAMAATWDQSSNKPTHIILPLFPCFQLLDIAGPLDILNIFTLPPFNAPFRLTLVAESLEPVPTRAIPPKNANYTYDLESIGMPDMNTTFNQYLTPQVTYADMLARMRDGKEEVDVILVPGGLGTRLERTYVDGRNEGNIKTLLDFLPEAMGLVKRAIITVCTGSDALARTRVLDGRRATTNMYRFDGVAARHQDVKWVKGARWVKAPAEGEKKDLWSSAGISAGMDVTLAWVADYAGGGDEGMAVSREIAKRLEYDWSEPGDGQVKAMYNHY